MTKDIDEDLIESTIRRVQGQKDAAADAPQEGPAPSKEPSVDDDAIEATIRRVQAQAAAADDASPTGDAELRSEVAEDDIEAQIRRVQAAVASARTESRELEADVLDPIEATIQRVQAQAAAQSATDEPTEDLAPEQEDDDVIAATIRRVQEQAADREDEPVVVEFDSESIGEPDDDAIAATIRRVQEQAADREDESDSVEFDTQPVDEPEDDAIAATILRVQQQAAARETASANGSEPETPIDDDDPIADTIRRVQSQAAARHDESSAFAPAPLPPIDDDEYESDVVEQAIHHAETGSETSTELAPAARKEPLETTSWPGRDNRMLGEPESWEVAARRLEQGLQETQLELRALARRFDALLPALERFVAAGDGAGLTIVPPQTPDEDWDESPAVSSMQFAAPPRPAVLRDPAPQSAAAHQLVEEPVAAGPRLRALDEHGNLNEHLPRQYRITVEDKRRGVDLVPLHRAMQGMQNVKDMSLLSYSNGVAIVSVESIGQIDPDALGDAVARCMSRATKVEVHNEQTMVVKIQEE